MSISTIGLLLGVALTAVAVLVHVFEGTGWNPGPDRSEEIVERRAARLPETEFPDPANRTPGPGGVAVSSTEETSEGTDKLSGDGVAADEEGPWTRPDDEANSFDVDYAKQGETVAVAENTTLLVAGENQGWDLPYACREGQCMACCARTVEGDARDVVVHDGQEMLDDDELADGYMLTCVAYPQAEFTLETHEKP